MVHPDVTCPASDVEEGLRLGLSEIVGSVVCEIFSPSLFVRGPVVASASFSLSRAEGGFAILHCESTGAPPPAGRPVWRFLHRSAAAPEGIRFDVTRQEIQSVASSIWLQTDMQSPTPIDRIEVLAEGPDHGDRALRFRLADGHRFCIAVPEGRVNMMRYCAEAATIERITEGCTVRWVLGQAG